MTQRINRQYEFYYNEPDGPYYQRPEENLAMINTIITAGSVLFAVALWILVIYLFTQIGANS